MRARLIILAVVALTGCADREYSPYKEMSDAYVWAQAKDIVVGK